MAEHYKGHPNVIGWQTDNEFGGTDCRCHIADGLIELRQRVAVAVRRVPVRQAALLDLYDPDRATAPLSVRRGQGAPVETTWKVLSGQLLTRL